MGDTTGQTNIFAISNAKRLRALTHVDREVEFTETYRRFENDHPFVRELECLRVQVPHSLAPIRDGDGFAGRLDSPWVGVDPEPGNLTECAYYCWFEGLRAQLELPDAGDELKRQVRSLLEFWDGRSTWHRCRRAFSDRLRAGLPRDDYYDATEISYPMFGLGGPTVDFAKLVRLGVDGLRDEVRRRRRASSDGECPCEKTVFLDCLSGALEIFSEAALRYADEAREAAAKAVEPGLADRYRRIADSCRHIAHDAPASYHQAIQLVWLYSLVALPKNYGRLDVTLGPLLARDLDQGMLSDDQARAMTADLWRLIVARGDHFNNRIVLGGVGRPDPAAADRFVMLALDTQAEVAQAIPQLALRWSEQMDPRIWDRAVEVIGRGSTQPMLYNDDVNVPAVAKAFAVSADEAEQYIMYGCGEYEIEHRSVGSPCAAVNLAKVLHATLFDGYDPHFDKKRGLALGELGDFTTFEAFRDAFARQLDNELSLLADAQATIYRETGRCVCYPLLSVLCDDCIERGKGLLSGGVRHLGGTCEAFGASTVSDSLLAIRRAVYEERVVTPGELLDALRTDFAGAEPLRRQLEAYPKFGNDDPQADEMNLWLNTFLCNACRRQGDRVGLDTFLIVLINNGDSITLGKGTAATPDGRRAGRPIANGNQPGAGYDRAGLTALLHSMSKLDPSLHAGVVHNVKLSRSWFRGRIAEVSALLKGYFAGGGTQVMITVVDRGELEDAMARPGEHANLIVRVGGYSERFVDLPHEIQLEIVRRTLFA